MRQAISMSKKRKIFILLSLVLSFALLFVVITDMPVFAITAKEVDNDDAQGNSNDCYDGNWVYITAASCKYGDAEKHATGSPSSGVFAYWYRYEYQYPVGRSGTIYVNLSVWLNHSDFTDPEAEYYVNGIGSYSMYSAGTLNQNIAPGGWSNFNTLALTNTDAAGNNVSRFTEVVASLKTNKYTGADLIRATYLNCQ